MKNKRAQVKEVTEAAILVIGVAICFLVYTTWLGNMAKERQATLDAQLKFEEGRRSYMNLLEVQDDFGNELGDLLSEAVATSWSAEDKRWIVERGNQPDKKAKIGGAPCGGTVMYPTMCCGGTSAAQNIEFVAPATYVSDYDITRYDVLRYVQCYFIPATFYPILGNSYKVTAKMGAREITTGNINYEGTDQKFYIAAPAGNPETLVEVSIEGEIQ